MNTEILGVILQWVALVVLCYPLGRYMAKVRAHVARLHGSARKGHLQGMQHRSRRGYGLEEVPQSSADGQPLLVLLGYGAALLHFRKK